MQFEPEMPLSRGGGDLIHSELNLAPRKRPVWRSRQPGVCCYWRRQSEPLFIGNFNDRWHGRVSGLQQAVSDVHSPNVEITP